MAKDRIVEYVFFFGFMAVVGFLVWEMLAPFVSALALAAIIVTICYPLYERITKRMPRKSETLGAFVTTIVVLIVVIIPLLFVISSLVNELVSIYNQVSINQFALESRLHTLETTVATVIPGFQLNLVEFLQQAASWLSSKVGVIFAGTASTVFLFFISMIGSFYLFRDGKSFTKLLVAISPLPNNQDELILRRMARAVRSVATGTIMVALIQGTLTGFGLWLFGFERAILWGTFAAFGALIPSVGTSIVFIPSIIYLLVTGAYLDAVGVAVWGMLAVGLIDNLLGPYLMSRGNKLHPFVILLSVLGGISVFGPIGFIVGPVIVSLFVVLLELYSVHISGDTKPPVTVE